jgi:CheY-like chemotaxis protein
MIYDSAPIVYVEDDPDDVYCFKAALKETKCANPLFAFATAELAQKFLVNAMAVEKTIPSFLLVDMILPGTSGFDFIRWVRQQDHLVNVPVVAVSGTYDFDQLDAGYSSGANLYYVKPADFEGWTVLALKLQTYWKSQPPMNPEERKSGRGGEI